MGLRGRVITEPSWVEITESVSDRKTRGQRHEAGRELHTKQHTHLGTFSKYLMGIYTAPGTVLDTRDLNYA